MSAIVVIKNIETGNIVFDDVVEKDKLPIEKYFYELMKSGTAYDKAILIVGQKKSTVISTTEFCKCSIHIEELDNEG